MDLRVLQQEFLKKARKVTDERIEIGALITTILSEEDGLKLKHRTEKPKKLVIIGVDRVNEVCYGSI